MLEINSRLDSQGIQECDTKGIITFSNLGHHKMLGYEAGELIGKNIWDFCVSKIDSKNLQKYLKNLLVEQPTPKPYILRCQRKDKQALDLQIEWDYRRDKKNKIIGFVSIIIEQRKHVNLHRLQSEIITNMAVGVNMAGEDGVIVYTNPYFDKMFGYEQGELIGKHVSILNSPKTRSPEKIVKEVVAALKKNQTWNGQVANIKKDGSYFLTEVTVSSFDHLEFGSVWVSAQNDITHRKEIEENLRKSEKSLADAQRLAGIGNWERNLDTGEIIWSNEMYNIFGVNPKKFKLNYDNFIACIHPDDREHVSGLIEASTRSKSEPIDLECRIILPDGNERIVLGKCEVFRSKNGKPVRMTGIVQNITERIKIEENQILSATVVENTAEAIVITDANNNIISVNKAYTDITGYTQEEVLGKNPRLLKSAMYDRSFFEKLWSTLLKENKWQGEILDRRKNGEIFPAWQTISVIRNEHGEIINFLSLISDITSIKQSEERLNFLAYHDSLTKLPNRLLMTDRLNHAIEHARREDHQLAVLFLDLDRFKLINDSLGHHVGDVLLQYGANRIVKLVRDSDTVARLGGDEFVIILEQIDDTKDAAVLAQKLMRAFGDPFMIDEKELTVTLSIGISVYPGDGKDYNTLVKNADAAMYRAKEQGRNDYQFYTPALTNLAFEHLTMDSALRHALENEELILYYQPQYSLKTGNLIGVEALIRWEHPEMGTISPDKFIPIAEESGLIVPVGEWVLRTACQQMKKWKKYKLKHMAVNISGRQFRKESILGSVKKVLKETRLNPELLELEITESIIMDEASHARILDELNQMGIYIAIDDFGTGYSSLSYLKRLPVHKLKIDSSFVRDIPGDLSDKAITTAIVAMGKSLNLKVIAEGVETKEQQDFLKSLGCDEAQGFLFSQPLPADQFEKLLKQKNETG